MTIKTRPLTPEYADGWDKIFGTSKPPSCKVFGRDINTLSREELIAALESVGKAYNSLLDQSSRSMRFMREINSARHFRESADSRIADAQADRLSDTVRAQECLPADASPPRDGRG